jgi:hypothetical protein
MARRNHNPEFKAKVVLAVLSGEKTPSEVWRAHKLHLNQLNRWRQEFRGGSRFIGVLQFYGSIQANRGFSRGCLHEKENTLITWIFNAKRIPTEME